MNPLQKNIIKEVAKRQGVPEYQAEDVWQQFINCLSTTMSTKRKNEDNTFREDDFPIIHVNNFGKFIPRVSLMKRLNQHILLKTKEKNNEKH